MMDVAWPGGLSRPCVYVSRKAGEAVLMKVKKAHTCRPIIATLAGQIFRRHF
jgi:hypothetical protein